VTQGGKLWRTDVEKIGNAAEAPHYCFGRSRGSQPILPPFPFRSAGARPGVRKIPCENGRSKLNKIRAACYRYGRM
jgi:hypothetical protein